MPSPTPDDAPPLVEMAVGIVAAYVSHNPVPPSELPSLITRVHRVIVDLATSGKSTQIDGDANGPTVLPNAAQIRNSVRPDGIISFIDGKTYKTLKRHLTAHGLDPRGYRERYGLPTDYPMVAEEYAERRSELARAIGLGRPGAIAEREMNVRKAA